MTSVLQRAQWAVPIAVQAAAMLRTIHDYRHHIEMDMAYPHAEWVVRDALAAVGTRE